LLRGRLNPGTRLRWLHRVGQFEGDENEVAEELWKEIVANKAFQIKVTEAFLCSSVGRENSYYSVVKTGVDASGEALFQIIAKS
jgi:hypothetical protein